MRELSLFSGAGGGLLGTKLLGWQHIGYVEFNEYCQRVIEARIKDGILDRAPIFTDVREFLESGAAREYRGFADVVTAGFPCQPFSVAGKQAGADDPRNMWPATIDVIRAVRPQHLLLENVPGLFAHEYIRTIFGDLAESGFYPKWDCLGASDVGAPHRRKRIWFVRNPKHTGLSTTKIKSGPTARNGSCETRQKQTSELEGSSEQCSQLAEKQQSCSVCKNVSDSEQHRLQGSAITQSRPETSRGVKQRCSVTRTPGEGIWSGSWWSTEPDVGRVADGVAFRVDRLKAIGNGQVPAVVRSAWQLLTK